MRHRNRGRKLGRNTAHRNSLCRNILIGLFRHGQIITTQSKAKEYAPMADKLITIAKRAEHRVKEMEKRCSASARGEITAELQSQMEKQAQAIRLASFRNALAKLPDKLIVRKIFHEIAPLYAERAGGYTKVLRLSKPRLGDNAPRAVLKLVANLPSSAAPEKPAKKIDKEKDKANKEKAEQRRKEKELKRREREKANEKAKEKAKAKEK